MLEMITLAALLYFGELEGIKFTYISIDCNESGYLLSKPSRIVIFKENQIIVDKSCFPVNKKDARWFKKKLAKIDRKSKLLLSEKEFNAFKFLGSGSVKGYLHCSVQMLYFPSDNRYIVFNQDSLLLEAMEKRILRIQKNEKGTPCEGQEIPVDRRATISAIGLIVLN